MTTASSAAGTGFRATLRNADYRRVAIALTIDACGSWAYGVVLLVYVFERTHSTTWVAVTAVVRYVPALLMSPYAGVVAEKYERTRVLITSALTCAVTMTLAAVLVGVHAPVALIVGLAVVNSTAYTVYPPAVGALVPDLVSEDQLASANAVQASIENLTIIIGPAIGGLLLLMSSAVPAFALNAASYVLAAFFVMRVRTRSAPTSVTEAGGGIVAQVAVGIRALMSSPRALVPVGYSFLATFVYGTDAVLFVPVSAHLHGGHGGYGYLLTGLAVGGLAATVVVNRAGEGRLAWWLFGGIALYCLPTVLIPFTHLMAVGLVVQVARGAGTLVVDVLALTALQRAVAPHLLSRVLGLFGALLFAATALGSLVTPALLHVAGLTTTLLVIAIATPAVALLGLPTLVRLDRDASSRLRRLRPTIDLLAGLPPFADATPGALERLAEAAQVVEVAAGDVVVCEGDAADAFYVVEQGEVSVTTSAAGLGVVRTLTAPGFFGEIGLLHGVRRTATVTATMATRLLRIGSDDFQRALTTAPVRAGIYAAAGARLAATHPALASEHEATEVVSS